MRRLLLCTLLMGLTQILNAQGWGQTQKVVPDDRFSGQQFGADVAIDGDYAVVGVLVSNIARDAYVFENDGSGNWIQLQKLESPNFNQFDHFGTTVAISGDYIFIGAWGQDYDANDTNFVEGAGAVYIFKKQTSGLFEFEQKIAASNREQNNHFGYTLDITDDYAIVGALRDAYDVDGNNYAENAGAAFIFERDTNGNWNEVQKIVASDRGDTDYFAGDGVSIEGNFAIVGARFEDEDATGTNTLDAAGSAYIFERNEDGNWVEVQKIVASNRQGSELFGTDVSVQGNTLIVGADQGNVDQGYTGSLYIFERDENGVWNEVQEIVASHTESLDRFGKSVDIDGNYLIVGAYTKNLGGVVDGGAGFVFEKDETGVWTEVAIMYDPNAGVSDYFGFTVALSEAYAIVGAYQQSEDETGESVMSQAGSAYIFNANEPNTLEPFASLSILDNDFDLTVKAYPNPVKNILYIDLGEFQEAITINVSNVLGQLVFSKTYNNTQSLQLELNQSKGIYVLELKSKTQVLSVLKVLKD